jgi:hypothetical protein
MSKMSRLRSLASRLRRKKKTKKQMVVRRDDIDELEFDFQ